MDILIRNYLLNEHRKMQKEELTKAAEELREANREMKPLRESVKEQMQSRRRWDGPCGFTMHNDQ